MTLRRRFALLLTVALTAAVSGAGTTTAAQASGGTICVALVVDGTPLGSNVSTSCAKVAKGATGIDVLQAAGHTVGFRNDGLVCTIDGLPKTGCSAVDDSHFWAYFHRAPGKTSWTYSTEGPSTYRPVNASTEGWVYRDGTDATPANVPYSQICKTKPTPSPSPTPSHKPSHHPSASPTPAHHAHAATAKPSATPSSGPTRSPSRHHPTAHGRRPLHHHRATSPPGHAANSAAPTISPSSAALVGGSTSSSSGGGSSAGLIIGLVAVLLLGGAAAYRFRRSAGRP